jgi:hypothetical protein
MEPPRNWALSGKALASLGQRRARIPDDERIMSRPEDDCKRKFSQFLLPGHFFYEKSRKTGEDRFFAQELFEALMGFVCYFASKSSEKGISMTPALKKAA